jgi:hypothetical protein
MSHETMPAHVAAAFAAFPEGPRERLMAVRRLIFEVAGASEGVGPLTETLKWGEPAYLTEASKAGSTIRLGVKRGEGGRCAVYFNCKTSLVGTFRTLFAGDLDFEGDRAVLFDVDGPVPEAPLAVCIGMALTYHRAGAKARV